MNSFEIETALVTAGFHEDISRRKRVNNCCTNIYLQDGGVLCVYDTGTVSLQGNATQAVCDWYEREVKRKNPKANAKRLTSDAEDFYDATPPDYENDNVRVLAVPDMWLGMEMQSVDELPPSIMRSTETAIISASSMQEHPEEKQPLPLLPDSDEW